MNIWYEKVLALANNNFRHKQKLRCIDFRESVKLSPQILHVQTGNTILLTSSLRQPEKSADPKNPLSPHFRGA